MTIDDIDQKLLLELQKDGRQNYTDLAKLLYVSETTVRNRLKRLLDKDIVKIMAVPHLETLGYSFIGIMGIQVQLGYLSTVAKQLMGHPNICYLANVTGRYDLMALVIAKSSSEFSELVENFLAPLPSILRTETFVNLHIYKGQVMGIEAGHLISNLDVT
jgi:Lrp/AsnC family transcriptional regulator for asnA, asnC and gidA